MPRPTQLLWDRGTLILHPPPRGAAWAPFATWDDRVERFRIPAHVYAELMLALRREGVAVEDRARAFREVDFQTAQGVVPYPHQEGALETWLRARRRGLVVLPTAAGKTYLAQLAMARTPRSTLVVVPTRPLLAQWYDDLRRTFPGVGIGVLGGGDRDGIGLEAEAPDVLVATYASAAIHAETLGNRYGLLVF